MARAKLFVVTILVCVFSTLFAGLAQSESGLLPSLDLGGLLGGSRVDPGAEQQFINLINRERALAGLPILSYDAELTAVARRHTADMANRHAIFHNELLDSLVSPVFRLLGENVGVGGSVESLHQAFLDSFTHRENVIGQFNKVGIGVVVSGSTMYVTELFGRVGTLPPLPTVAGIAADATGGGYWLATTGGGVLAYGDAARLGSAAGTPLARPVVGIAAKPNGRGYWLVASDGGVFNYGESRFHGSTGNIRLASPIVGMASTPSGNGYWLVASDGGVFAFGDAGFFGSTGAMRIAKPVVGMSPTPSGRGYWMVASDGGVFAFGDARFLGSTGNIRLVKPVVGMAATASGRGYWMVASDGGMFSFGDAPFLGSVAGRPLDGSVVGMARTPLGGGYWLAVSGREAYAFGTAPAAGGS